MTTKTMVYINGSKLQIDIEGLRHGDQVKKVWEQCEGCGTALDAEGEAFLFAKYGRHEIQCGVCATVYPIEGQS